MRKLIELENILIYNSVNIDGILNWVSEQGVKIVLIILLFGVFVAAAKGSFKLLISILIVGGLIYLFVSSPESIIKSIADIWRLAFN